MPCGIMKAHHAIIDRFLHRRDAGMRGRGHEFDNMLLELLAYVDGPEVELVDDLAMNPFYDRVNDGERAQISVVHRVFVLSSDGRR